MQVYIKSKLKNILWKKWFLSQKYIRGKVVLTWKAKQIESVKITLGHL